MIKMLAISIPLTLFDQQKIEFLVRKIPEALTWTEQNKETKKKFYVFPENSHQGFQIRCEANYYLDASLPSFSSCEIDLLKPVDENFDEHKIEIFDNRVINSLINSLSYTKDVKKLYSLERVYGVSLNGSYQKHFRFSFDCSLKRCYLTLSTRPPEKF